MSTLVLRDHKNSNSYYQIISISSRLIKFLLIRDPSVGVRLSGWSVGVRGAPDMCICTHTYTHEHMYVHVKHDNLNCKCFPIGESLGNTYDVITDMTSFRKLCNILLKGFVSWSNFWTFQLNTSPFPKSE